MNTLLAENMSWSINAIDIDSEAIRLSQEIKETKNLVNITVSQASIEDYSGRNYDIIISNDVLEHLKDDTYALEKLADMLKPGGILCVSVPALQWLFGYHDEMLGHFRRYNKQLLLAKLSAHFEVKRSRYFGGTLVPIAVLYSGVLRRPYPVGQQDESSVMGRMLNALLELERNTPLPIGTSLIAMATSPTK
jgi:SAM-dependent methyltransferase